MPAPTPLAPDFDRLLQGVSRSFYLSIRLLPAALRAPVSVAYLLARATDTVADAAGLPAVERLAALDRMRASLLDGPAWDADAIAGAVGVPQEQELLRRWDTLLGELDALPRSDQASVNTVLGHITRGQALDLQRFPGDGAVHALPDAAALDEYTYLVAGCVGEFWTDLCLAHLPAYAARPPQEMRQLGRSFGMGLQLVNIVRDLGDDLAAGRCYLPADELAAAGLTPDTATSDADRLLPVWRHWQQAAERRLEDGIAYAEAVGPRRLRASVALPALIGRRTLQRLEAAGPAALHTRVKVPRSEVYALLARLAFTFASRRALRAGWDNPAR